MNKILKLLIFSDIFVLTGFGLISPIMAIFIKDLAGGTLAAVGIASAITIFIRCALQLLFAYIAKPKHRYIMALGGTLLIAAVPFIYMFTHSIGMVYVASVIHGIGAGLCNPAWFSLFAANLDKKQRGWEWSIYSSSVGIGTAASAFAGSMLATKFGFTPIFAAVGILSLAGCVILLGLFRDGSKNHNSKIVGAKFKLHAHPHH